MFFVSLSLAKVSSSSIFRLLFSWLRSSSACESAVQQPNNRQTCSQVNQIEETVFLHSRAHSVELLTRGGEPQVLVVGDHLERVRAARHGLRPALSRVEGPRHRHQEQDEEGWNARKMGWLGEKRSSNTVRPGVHGFVHWKLTLQAGWPYTYESLEG